MIIDGKLKVKIVEEAANDIAFKIISQPNSWRNTEGAGFSIFLPSNTNKYCRIRSYISPPVAREWSNILYIWGSNDGRARDNRTCRCSRSFFSKIERTIKKVNEDKYKGKYIY